jgi:carbon-monoxide dehydrogenase medium subunit
MRPAKFEYFDPDSTGEALTLLEKYGADARVLAGGLSLVSLMKLRLLQPAQIIDIGKIPGFSYIKEGQDGGLSVGALTDYYTIETSSLAQSLCPILAETAAGIGDPQVRNRGTIGGNVCQADPAGDYPPVILALDAELTALSASGERTIPASEFFLDVYTTALEPAELLTGIRVSAMPPNTGQSFLKLTYKSGAAPIVSAAVVMTLDNGNVCKAVRIALAAVAATPVRAEETEAALLGKPVTDELIKDAAERVSGAIDPTSDVHATAGYRKDMAAVVTRRALQAAFSRAGGEK